MILGTISVFDHISLHFIILREITRKSERYPHLWIKRALAVPRILRRSGPSIYSSEFHTNIYLTCCGCLKEEIQRMVGALINATVKHWDTGGNSELFACLWNPLIPPFCLNLSFKRTFQQAYKGCADGARQKTQKLKGLWHQREALFPMLLFMGTNWAIFPAEASFCWTVVELTAVHSLALWGFQPPTQTCINLYVQNL